MMAAHELNLRLDVVAGEDGVQANKAWQTLLGPKHPPTRQTLQLVKTMSRKLPPNQRRWNQQLKLPRRLL
jgi:hypothetical protein